MLPLAMNQFERVLLINDPAAALPPEVFLSILWPPLLISFVFICSEPVDLRLVKVHC